MSYFELIALENIDGCPLGEKPELSAKFEAVDEDAARDEGYRRSKGLPPGHLAALFNDWREQLATWDSPSS
jgi:hypothetical protein